MFNHTRIQWTAASAALLLAGAQAAMADDYPVPPAAAAGVRISIVARGLHDPRGLAISPDGDIYVAEAGTTQGPFTPPPPPPPAEPPSRTTCSIGWPLGPVAGGYTGRISKIGRHGHVSTVADELPSTGYNSLVGGDRMGVGAVTFVGDRLFAILAGGGCSHQHPSEPNSLMRVFNNGVTLPFGDLSNYFRTTEDSKSPDAPDFEADGTWTNLIHALGGFYAVEPNHGAFVRIERNGAITPVADMIAKVAAIDANGDGDKTYTSLIKHKGYFYIGTLGRIDTGFEAFIYRVSLDGRRVKQVASGLQGVIGIAFDKQDRLYALETTDASAPPLSNPAAGRLVRVERNGTLTPLVTGLSFPTALIAGAAASST